MAGFQFEDVLINGPGCRYVGPPEVFAEGCSIHLGCRSWKCADGLQLGRKHECPVVPPVVEGFLTEPIPC